MAAAGNSSLTHTFLQLHVHKPMGRAGPRKGLRQILVKPGLSGRPLQGVLLLPCVPVRGAGLLEGEGWARPGTRPSMARGSTGGRQDVKGKGRKVGTCVHAGREAT